MACWWVILKLKAYVWVTKFTIVTARKRLLRFLKELFSREGFPRFLISDNGVQFASGEMEMFLKKGAARHLKSSLYYPQMVKMIA